MYEWLTHPARYQLTVRTIKDGDSLILPQYLANLTQPVGTKKVIYLGEIHRCTNNIVYGKFGVTRFFCETLLAFLGFSCATNYGSKHQSLSFSVRSVRMSIFRVFVCYELWVKVPVAIFYYAQLSPYNSICCICKSRVY